MSHSTNNKTSGFFSSLKKNYTQKFANVSIQALEKDGNSEQDTLIHNAFVKYFDQRHEPYPDWLGMPQKGGNGNVAYGAPTRNQNMYSQYQPVQNTNTFNNSYQQQQIQQHGYQYQQQNQQQNQQHQLEPGFTTEDRPLYGRKSSLQALHDKSRQQVVPGSGYTSLASQTSPARVTGHSTTGSRLREKMFTNQGRYEK